MTDNLCAACGDRPADAGEICNWCGSLCLCCGDQPIEFVLTWGRRDGLSRDFCLPCREADEQSA